jgi:hypothetical protein
LSARWGIRREARLCKQLIIPAMRLASIVNVMLLQSSRRPMLTTPRERSHSLFASGKQKIKPC